MARILCLGKYNTEAVMPTTAEIAEAIDQRVLARFGPTDPPGL